MKSQIGSHVDLYKIKLDYINDSIQEIFLRFSTTIFNLINLFRYFKHSQITL